METLKIKIVVLWVAVICGFALHTLADLLPLFWGENITIEATGNAPAGLLAFLEEPYEKTPEHDALIAKIDACNKADAEAQADPHFFDEFLEKWDRGEYHD